MKRLLRPPAMGDDVQNSVARNVHVFNQAILLAVFFLFVVRMLQDPSFWPRWLATLGMVAVFTLACLLLNARGHSFWAGFLSLAATNVVVLVTVTTAGGLPHQSTHWLVALAIIGTTLFRQYGWLISGGAAAAATAILFLGTVRGAFPPAPPATPLTHWSTIVAVIAFGAAVQHLAARQLRRSLRNTRGALEQRDREARAIEADALRLRLAAEVGGLGVWEIDTGTGQVTAEEGAFALFGLSPQSKGDAESARTAEFWLARIQPDDGARMQRAMERLVTTGERMEEEYRILHADGRERIFHTTATLVRENPPRADRVVGVTVDVTARRQAERDRARMIADLGHRVRELSLLRRAAAVLRDTSGDRSWMKELVSLVPGGSRRPELCAVRVDFGKETALEGVWPVSPWTVSASFQVGEESGVLALAYAGHPGFSSMDEERDLLHALADLVQVSLSRNRADAARRKREEEYRSLFESAAIGIAVLAEGGRCLSCNPAFAYFLGYSAGDLSGTSIEDWIAEEDLSGSLQGIADVFQRRRFSFEREVRFRKRGGDEVWGLMTVCVLASQEYVLAFIQDVTERRRVQEASASLQKEVFHAQKLQSLGTLAGGIAHDFNNTLTMISAGVRLAQSLIARDHPAAESLDAIDRAAARAGDLVSQILAFSRGAEPHRKQLDLDAEAQEAARLLRATLGAQIALREEYARDTPPVFADPGQIQHVLANLATNAAHAMPAGGTLTLRVETATLEEESAVGLPAGSYATLLVADTGIGMSVDTVERIFEPFFTTKPAGEGSGLGLSVVHRIVESHGGRIVVESEPGRGSSFRVYLPASPPEPRAPAVADPARAARSVRVLFVDDEELIGRLIANLLMMTGHATLVFQNPVLALEEFRRDPDRFDVVVTDASMPGLSGLNLAREILALRPHVPIVLCSGHFTAKESAAAEALGIRKTLHKPYAVEELEELIAALAGVPR